MALRYHLGGPIKYWRCLKLTTMQSSTESQSCHRSQIIVIAITTTSQYKILRVCNSLLMVFLVVSSPNSNTSPGPACFSRCGLVFMSRSSDVPSIPRLAAVCRRFEDAAYFVVVLMNDLGNSKVVAKLGSPMRMRDG